MNSIMKNGKQLLFNIDVFFEDAGVIATDIVPVSDASGNIVNSSAYQDYLDFIGMVEEIFDYYEFNVTVAATNSVTSYYYWVARNTEIADDNVPYYIRLRVSDHVQQFSDEGKKVVSQKDKDNAERLKRPKTKKRQRYKLRNIIVNKENFNTYEEALTEFESTVREWLTAKGVDVDAVYGPMNEW